MPTKLVYQGRVKRWRNLFLALVLLVLCVVVAAGWLDAPVGRRAELGIAAALVVAVVLPAIWRQLRAPQPILLLDDEGIEGSFGFVPWTAVADFRLRRRVVRFTLEAGGGGPRTPRHDYVSAGADSDDDVLKIPFWASRSTVADDLRTYLPAVALSALDR